MIDVQNAASPSSSNLATDGAGRRGPDGPRRAAGKRLIIVATILFGIAVLAQTFYKLGLFSFGFETWRPVVYAYVLWGVALGLGQVWMHGNEGKKSLFVLPAVLFTVAMVIFPTFFG